MAIESYEVSICCMPPSLLLNPVYLQFFQREPSVKGPAGYMILHFCRPHISPPTVLYCGIKVLLQAKFHLFAAAMSAQGQTEPR
jgi:hypothetical protein